MTKTRIVGISCFAFLLFALVAWPQQSPGFSRIATVPATQLQYTDLTCATGETCSYQITAFNTAGESGPSNTISIMVTGAPPTTRAIFRWTASVVDATHAAPTEYRIYTGARNPNPPTALVGVAN